MTARFSGDTRYRNALLMLPALGALALILYFGQNTPFWDDWELVPIFQHLHAGHFYWHDFWQQHNEHRIPIPTLILVGLAYVTRWNLLAECALSLLVAVGAFWVLCKATALTAQGGVRKPAVGWLLAISLIWFSLGQVENWLWGWQLEWFLNVLGVVSVVYGLARLQRGSVTGKWLLLMLGGGALAQYSLGNGTLLWPLMLLAMLYLRAAAWQTVATLITGTLTTAVYYSHYSLGIDKASRHLALHHPTAYAEYILLYIGRPLSYRLKPALGLGIVSLGVFFILAGYLLWRRRQLFRRTIPWIVLGLYALGSAVITGAARLGFGVNEAMSSRYTTIASLFLVSVLMLIWTSREAVRKVLKGVYRPALIAVGIGLYGLVLINMAWGVHAAAGQHTKLVAAHTCTQVREPTDTCVLTIYPDSSMVKSRIQYLKTVHWGGY